MLLFHTLLLTLVIVTHLRPQLNKLQVDVIRNLETLLESLEIKSLGIDSTTIDTSCKSDSKPYRCSCIYGYSFFILLSSFTSALSCSSPTSITITSVSYFFSSIFLYRLCCLLHSQGPGFQRKPTPQPSSYTISFAYRIVGSNN